MSIKTKKSHPPIIKCSKGKIEEISIKLNIVDAQTNEEWIEVFPPMFSEGIIRTGEWDENVESYHYTDNVFFRDYAGNNMIYV